MKLPFNNRNRVTQPWSRSHYGLDIVGDDDRRVLAVCSGRVVTSTIITNTSDQTWEWGNYVRIDGDDGKRYFYCHLSSRFVSAGQRITEGTQVGVMGNTGKSFGAHLHLQIRSATNTELNVAEIIGVPNAVGVYTTATLAPAAPPLYIVSVGPVSNGDAATIKALADKMQVPFTAKSIT